MGGPVPLSSTDGEFLVNLAAATVHARLGGTPVNGQAPRSHVLRRVGCSFVTLERDHSLRGCIGSLEPSRPLYRDVVRNAARATADPRLPPVTADEWPELSVSVSVLGPAEPMLARGLADLPRQLRPGIDGLILTAGRHQATFLPAVWRKLPDPDDFVAALLAKGGWTADRVPPGILAHRYTVMEFHSCQEGPLAAFARD
jgi:AmmeMemoRadiSam system protein A